MAPISFTLYCSSAPLHLCECNKDKEMKLWPGIFIQKTGLDVVGATVGGEEKEEEVWV